MERRKKEINEKDPAIPSEIQIPEDVKKEIEKIQQNLNEFKKTILKKFSWIAAIGIIPPQASKLIEEEEEVEKAPEEKLIHLILLVPEERAKKIAELKLEAIKLVQNLKPKVWIHTKTIPELWEICLDGKFALMEAISMAFPLHDKSILGALRVASIHKTLTLRKFERYVVSYVLAGSIVRGETTKTSDIDVYVVINDTDVKRMSRHELREKLRAIIYSYAFEAGNLAGVPNKLNPQIYLLTEFWEAVKDANPVIFTFIRDGIPLYDSGAFIPWKLLLRMGKIKPSPEAIDMFMSLGDKIAKTVERKLNEIATEDIYWGVLTPSQALLMLYGVPPPTPKETIPLMREIFVIKEKLLEPEYVEILDKIVTIYKKYEHEEIKTISGKEIDELLAKSSKYIARLKQLMKEIEQRRAEREIPQLCSSVFDLLKGIFGNIAETSLIKKFEQELIAKAKIAPRNLSLLKKLLEIRKKSTTGKITKHDIAEAHSAAHELTATLLDYTRRLELIALDHRKLELIYKVHEEGKEVVKRAQLFPFKDVAFIIPDVTVDVVKKWQAGKLQDSSKEELKNWIEKKAGLERRITPELFAQLKELFGSFELLL